MPQDNTSRNVENALTVIHSNPSAPLNPDSLLSAIEQETGELNPDQIADVNTYMHNRYGWNTTFTFHSDLLD